MEAAGGRKRSTRRKRPECLKFLEATVYRSECSDLQSSALSCKLPCSQNLRPHRPTTLVYCLCLSIQAGQRKNLTWTINSTMESSNRSCIIFFEVACVVVQIAGMSRLLYFRWVRVFKKLHVFCRKKPRIKSLSEELWIR